MKYLIVGLGNPGSKYEETRHNVGFKIVDELVRQCQGEFESNKFADVANIKYKGKILIVIKPTTFMNLSGKSVNYWMQKEKIPINKILIITDDISLPFGKIRMKGKGSDGGHNGLKDIQLVLNSSKYSRLRFGVGNDFYPGRQSEYVLGEWLEKEKIILYERIDFSTEFIKGFVSIGLQLTMTNFNNK